MLELHGRGELGEQLHRLSLENRWSEMGGLIDDEVLGAFAVVGAPEDAGAELLRRFGDVFTRASLYTPYEIEPEVSRRVVAAIRAAAAQKAGPPFWFRRRS